MLRREKFWSVRCDNCEKLFNVDTTKNGILDKVDNDETWKKVGCGKHYCPECLTEDAQKTEQRG